MTLPQITKFVFNSDDLTSNIKEFNTYDEESLFQYNIFISDYYIVKPLPKNVPVILEINNEQIDLTRQTIEQRSTMFNTIITISIKK